MKIYKLRQVTIMGLIFGDVLIFYEILFLPEVKQRMIFSNKHGISELSHQLRNDLRLTSLRN